MPEESKLYKTFIAFTFDDQSEERLSRLQAILKPRLKTVRWTRPEQFHITAAYLDMIDVQQVTKAAITIADIQKKFFPLHATVTEIEGFPSVQNSRIIYAKFGGSNLEYFIEIVTEIRAALLNAGIRYDTKPFIPHITVGRAKTAQNLNKVQPLLQHTKVTIASLAVYISQHTDAGFEYTEVKV